MARKKQIRYITVTITTTPEKIAEIKSCDKIFLRMISTTGECADQIATYSEKYVDYLLDD